MIRVSEQQVDEWIQEDVPYIDLTTLVLGFGRQRGRIAYFSREQAVLCGTEEVCRVLEKLNIAVEDSRPSGSHIQPGDVFLQATGLAQDLHMAWKVCQNIFDHCSGIATKSHQMVQKARSVSPGIALVGTRKGFPGTKRLAVKAMITGGVLPHRLGLSETILVFKQHLNFIGGLESFIARVPHLKRECCEKKLIVEAETVSDCLQLCQAGVDGLQLDKFPAAELKELVPRLKEINPGVVLLAAGGINENNVLQYAQTGVDALVTTSIYNAGPIDIGVRLTPVEG